MGEDQLHGRFGSLFCCLSFRLRLKKEIVYSDIRINKKEAIAIIEKQFKQLFARLEWLPYGWMDGLIN